MFVSTILFWSLITGPPSISDSHSPAAVESLRAFLAVAPENREKLEQLDFANVPLTLADAEKARQLLADDRLERLRTSRMAEMKAKVLTHDNFKMPFSYQVFGEKPNAGRSLFISLHGGGGAPKAVNDQQWENQKRLYKPSEGVYVAPRAPTDTWNLWHQEHLDPLLIKLIENMVAFEDVRWDRVYLMGYSAGGDGVYQLAPRLSDRWAAAAMMAGHPNETSPLGLRNVPFALQVGGKDAAYNRNKIGADWQVRLAELQKSDPNGYEHFVKIYPDKGHWMDREDAVAIDWMANYTRNATPKKIVWLQDDVTHSRYYWLGIDKKDAKAGAMMTAEVQGQDIELTTDDVSSVDVFLDDRFIDLDQVITIRSGDTVVYQGQVDRTIAGLANTLEQRGDPGLSYPGLVKVEIP